ncbi:MAG: hypothetical protein ACRDDY_12560 [Clostridium sp.]|uniref:hypothetical protein n=1 Tax=Clostridium sp. TaxID=1506 RepID=UPI003EE780A7
MNKIIQKTLSLVLLILLTLLIFDYFKVIEFDKILKNSFAFIIVTFSIISSMTVILSSSPGYMKFINYVIIISLFLGGILIISNNKFNIFVAIFLLFTISYSLIDMLYKNN